MNPLMQFETAAHQVWRSTLTMDEKARKFLSISRAVEHYLQRLEDAQRAKKPDAWGQAMYGRAKDYLNRLTADLKWLAHNCQVASASLDNLAHAQKETRQVGGTS